MTRDFLGRLRLGNKGTAMICGVVEHHLRPAQMSHGREMPTSRAVYRYFRDVGNVATDTLYLSLADHLAAFKIPDRLWLRSDPLPRGGTDKTDRRALRAQCLAADTEAGAPINEE